MTTRTKGVTVGPATVIVAASSKLRGTRGRRGKRKHGMFGRNVAAASRAATKVRRALRQLERATMMIGAVVAGLELLREVRVEGSNQTPDGRRSPASSRSRSVRPSSKASRTSSSRAKRSVSKSQPRGTKKRGGPRKKKTRVAPTPTTKRRRSRATAKKAGGVRATTRTRKRTRTSTKRARPYRRAPSSTR